MASDSRLSQKSFALLVFGLAIFSGMQIASKAVGQTPASPLSPAPQPSPSTSAPPAANPTDASNAEMYRLQGEARAKGMAAGNPNGQLPAFGPAAIRAAEGISEQSADANKGPQAPQLQQPQKRETFVPSEVVSYAPSQTRAGDPRAILHTSLGDIVIRLHEGAAPRTVRNFIDLVRGDKEFLDAKTSKKSRRPFYTNMIFHRTVPGYLIQTGCPFGTGRGGPGHFVPDEISSSSKFDRPYLVAMAPQREGTNFVKNSNGSQFFITLGTMPEWDDKFTIFGEVEKGQSVVEKISRSKTGPTDRPIRRVFLLSVDVIDETTANVLPTTSEQQ